MSGFMPPVPQKLRKPRNRMSRRRVDAWNRRHRTWLPQLERFSYASDKADLLSLPLEERAKLLLPR